MSLINQVVKLKEIEGLVKEGKVTKEVYDKLVDDVLKERITENKLDGAIKVSSRNPKKSKRVLARLAGVIKGSKRKKREGSRNAPTEIERAPPPVTNRVDPGVKEEPPGAQLIEVRGRVSVQRRKLLEDELMRLGQDRQGRAKWKKVKVTLYDDCLEYHIQGKQGEVRNRKVVHLSEDFFVSSEVNKQQLAKMFAAKSTRTDLDTKDVYGQPHLFLLSDLDENYYFAAEDEVKKEFWVSMLVQTIRDIAETAKPNFSTLRGGTTKSKRYVSKYETLKKNHYQKNIRKTLRLRKLEDLEDENFVQNSAKWQRQGDKYARQSVTADFKRQEMERAKVALEQQDILKKQLEDKQKALDQITKKFEENDQEWRKKYDNLLEEKREEARQRNQEKEREKEEIEKEIRAMQRQQATTIKATNFSNLTVDQKKMMEEYEAKLSQYKAKLEALESALDLDISNLDWDGTLQDAEKKMQALVPDLMSADDEVRREAQAKFDQWDNIVRNHTDYKNREIKKWQDWEENNKQKNLAALKEMRELYVPERYLTGISKGDLMMMTKCQPKTARRVMQNKIFKFLWMDKQRIAKIHAADLLNNYASQGLDIRELRAVYACLPQTFQNDSDGRKKGFRDTLRTRLFELTTKEEKGTLTSNEEMHNAYRKKEIRVRNKIAGGKVKGPRVKKNKAFANKALALQAMLNQRNDGPPPAKSSFSESKPKITLPAAASAAVDSSSSGALDPKDPQWAVYLRMKKNGLPDGAIMNRMQKDKKDPSLWHELVALSEKSGPPAPSSRSERTTSLQSFFDTTDLHQLRKTPIEREPMKEMPNLRSAKITRTSDSASTKAAESVVTKASRSVEMLKAEEPAAVRSSVSSLKIRDKGDIRKKKSEKPGKKKVRKSKTGSGKKKQTLRKHSKKNRQPSHVNKSTNAEELLVKVQFDAVGSSGRVIRSSKTYGKGTAGAKNLNNLAYGKKNVKKTGKKMKNEIDKSIQELVDIITEEGDFDEAEGGKKTMSFGELFMRYETQSDMLVGFLLKAKRQGLIKYRGDMLFRGIHDEIKITVK